MSRFRALLDNPHTTWAGVAFGLCMVGEIWLPQYAAQFRRTGQIALVYATVMGADAKSVDSVDGKSKTSS